MVFQKWHVSRKQDPSDFWMSIDQFLSCFNTAYVLFSSMQSSLLQQMTPERERALPVLTVTGRWLRKCPRAAGGCTAGGAWPSSKTWTLNPMFQLTVLTNKTWVRIVLMCTNSKAAGPAVKFLESSGMNAERGGRGRARVWVGGKTRNRDGPQVVLGVLREETFQSKGPNLDFEDFVHVSVPCDTRRRGQLVAPELVLDSDSSPYIIVPMLTEPEDEGSFRLDVCSSEPCFLRGRSYDAHAIAARDSITSIPTSINPDAGSDWEDSHQQDDASLLEPETDFDSAAWGSLATGKVRLHPRIVSALHYEGLDDMVPDYDGQILLWHQGLTTVCGDTLGGVVGWTEAAQNTEAGNETKEKVKGLLLRCGFTGLDRLAQEQPKLRGMIHVQRENGQYHVTEHRVQVNIADGEHGSQTLLARMASFGRAQDVSIVGEVVYCDPLHADGKLRNVRELRGKVVCIPHGGASSPQEKALRAFHAGVVAVILIADSEDTHAVAADHSLALDKSSNMMATVKFKDVVNDMWKIELRTRDIFTVSRRSILMTDDVTIPVIMIGKAGGEALMQSRRKPGLVGKKTEVEINKTRKEGKQIPSGVSNPEVVAEPIKEEGGKRRPTKSPRRDTKDHATIKVADDKSGTVAIVSESFLLLRFKSELALELKDKRRDRIVLNLVGISLPEYRDADVESVYVSLQFYHYQDLRDVAAVVLPCGSSGDFQLSSVDDRFRPPNSQDGTADCGVHIAFDLDPFNTGMEADLARNDLLASYLLSHNLEISLWARTAGSFFALGTATLPLFVLLRQQRDSVLFHGSLPIRDLKRASGEAWLDEITKKDNLLHIRAVNVGVARSRPPSDAGSGALVAASAHENEGSASTRRITSLMPARATPKPDHHELLDVAVTDVEVEQMARKELLYDAEAPLDRSSLPFSVEFFELDRSPLSVLRYQFSHALVPPSK